MDLDFESDLTYIKYHRRGRKTIFLHRYPRYCLKSSTRQTKSPLHELISSPAHHSQQLLLIWIFFILGLDCNVSRAKDSAGHLKEINKIRKMVNYGENHASKVEPC